MKRTIQSILNIKTGDQLDIAELFDSRDMEAELFALRSVIEEQFNINEPVYVCSFCKQPVAIRGLYNPQFKKKEYYLAHMLYSKPCYMKTGSRLTREQVLCIKYNGVKESEKHITLKHLLAQYLTLESTVIKVLTEKVYRDKAISMNWKKPDVMAFFPDKKIAFELQLSTTFLSVIVDRTLFYRNRDVFLIWVFPAFSVESDLQPFTQKDVYYNNSINVYVLDDEAIRQCEVQQRLILKCYYKKSEVSNGTLKDYWSVSLIGLSDLTFNFEKKEVFFYDSIAERRLALEELKALEQQQEQAQQEQAAHSRINQATAYLRNYYKEDYDPYFGEERPEIDYLDSPREIQQFNDGIGLSGRNASLVSELFVTGKKPNFLKYICEEDRIDIDTAGLTVEKQSLFEYLLCTTDQHSFYRNIRLLFRKGFTLSEENLTTLEHMYNTNYFNTSDSERQQMERWAFVKGLDMIWSRQDKPDLMEFRKVFFAIMSLKFDKPIGFAFQNLRQVTNYVLDRIPEYSSIYIKAMEAIGAYERQIAEDKKGKLKIRLDNFRANPSNQTTRFNYLIYQIFPEIDR